MISKIFTVSNYNWYAETNLQILALEECEYKYGLVEDISHFNNYNEEKKYLFEHHKKYKNSLHYEHL